MATLTTKRQSQDLAASLAQQRLQGRFVAQQRAFLKHEKYEEPAEHPLAGGAAEGEEVVEPESKQARKAAQMHVVCMDAQLQKVWPPGLRNVLPRDDDHARPYVELRRLVTTEDRGPINYAAKWWRLNSLKLRDIHKEDPWHVVWGATMKGIGDAGFGPIVKVCTVNQTIAHGPFGRHETRFPWSPRAGAHRRSRTTSSTASSAKNARWTRTRSLGNAGPPGIQLGRIHYRGWRRS